jgi:hypothetical protein
MLKKSTHRKNSYHRRSHHFFLKGYVIPDIPYRPTAISNQKHMKFLARGKYANSHVQHCQSDFEQVEAPNIVSRVAPKNPSMRTSKKEVPNSFKLVTKQGKYRRILSFSFFSGYP